MRRRLLSPLCVLVVAFGCGGHAEHVFAPESLGSVFDLAAVTSIARKSIAPPYDVHERCREIRVGQHAFLDTRAKDGVGDRNVSQLSPVYGRCTTTPGGAWVLTLDELGDGACHGACATVRTRLHHLSETSPFEAVADAYDEAEGEILEWGFQDEVTRLIDFDGDGEEEIFVERRAAVSSAYEGDDPFTAEDTFRGEVFTFRDGAIVPNRATRGLAIQSFSDTDLDGRPDAFVASPYVGNEAVRITSDGESPIGFESLEILAHSLPDGTFTRDDVIARGYVQSAECPTKPETIVIESKGVVDLHATSRNVACARMYGADASAVVAAIESVRAEIRAQEHGDASSVDRLVQWAMAEPPTKL